ncbi:hypothetical protein SNE25_27040 [Mucilaginibacter sabulilitoris]|uniref:NHL repeat-containing protein n=1 Tax=Mucilaginibacter sabulilitoris TaxID=1173583 RepID=A0ABZ0TIF9_9SPHI|nr:hypothetical protein [Mucilaginibacter sabulilitoris]WPU92985.1 hypothetical protein SNE25_27040 [Mucilaginibacter sabulilitoris]
MKIKFTYVSMLVVAFAITSCTKNEQPVPEINTDQRVALTTDATTAAKATAPNTISTIAGQRYTSGATKVDGPALSARFNFPTGLFTTESGILYVADTRNNAIRQILNGQVTTLTLAPNNYGETIHEPIYVGLQRIGTIHVICAVTPDGDPYSQSWIFGPTGEFVASQWDTYVERACLAKDPYSDVFWTSVHMEILKDQAVTSEYIGKDPVQYDTSILPENDYHRGTVYRAMFVGYNNVKYLGVNNHMYKLTPSGVFARIYADLSLGNISCIIANKDSRTIYFAADGYIKKIVNNKLTILAGPNAKTPDGRDGVGLLADVHARSLVLAKFEGENTIYFTDTFTNTIRKLSLK